MECSPLKQSNVDTNDGRNKSRNFIQTIKSKLCRSPFHFIVPAVVIGTIVILLFQQSLQNDLSPSTKTCSSFCKDRPWLYRHFITPEEAYKIVDIVEHCTWNDENDIDGKPLEQIDFPFSADGNVSSPCPEVDSIINHHLRRALQMASQYTTDEKLIGFACIRHYSPETRSKFSLHLDGNIVSLIVPLNPKSEYEGGELYMFSQAWTEQHFNNDWNWDTRQTLVDNRNNQNILPTVDFDVGDAIIFYGMKHAHGVLPVTKGMRYSLIYFLTTEKKQKYYTEEDETEELQEIDFLPF